MQEKKSNKAAQGYSQVQWDALRAHIKVIKDQFGSYDALGAEIGVKGNTLLSFVLGRSKGLSSETIAALEAKGLLPDLAEPEPTAEVESTENPPLVHFAGETKTISQVAKEKGYTPATIRKYCRSGRLNYVISGKRRRVAVDEKYAALPQTELGRLRAENESLRAENEVLRKQVETMQLEFAWDAPVVDHDSDVDMVVPPEFYDDSNDDGEVIEEREKCLHQCILQ